MDENDYPFLYIRVTEQCLDCCFTFHSHTSYDNSYRTSLKCPYACGENILYTAVDKCYT